MNSNECSSRRDRGPAAAVVLSRLRAAFTMGLLVVVMMGGAGCRTRSFLSTRQEVSLGKEGARQVEQELRVDTSTPDADRVRRIGMSLLPHMDRRDVPYTFKVIDGKEINAFSLPGGPVYVYRGLLDMMGNDDDGLACVLGHEAGHVNGRHVARMISSNLVNNIMIGVLIQNPTAQNVAGLADEVAGLKFSRDDEYDADRRGLSYAHFAGYDANGMVHFFEKLQRMEKREGGHGPEWLLTHPLTAARIQRAQALITKGDYRYGQ